MAFLAAAVLGAQSAADDAAEGASTRSYKLQLGLAPSSPLSLEEPFINIAKAKGAGWDIAARGDKSAKMSSADAAAAGLLDPKTYLPRGNAGSVTISAGPFFANAERFRSHYDDVFVLKWSGDASGRMERWTAEGGGSPGRSEWRLSGPRLRGGLMKFSDVRGSISGIELYRKRYERLLERGEIWNPEFLRLISRYDVIRTMDLQGTNNSRVRSFGQIAGMSDPWGQGSGAVIWPEPPFYSIPYEVLFDLGVKANVELWVTVPPQIGSPVSAADPALRRKDFPDRIHHENFTTKTAEIAKTTLESEEWDRFADAFAERLIKSGYPPDRPLYVEVGNEIWNYGRGFITSTSYARGVALAFDPKWKVGHGYGVLSARWMIALESALARRKATPKIVYVVASHTVDPFRTKQAFTGMRAYFASKGLDPDNYLPKTGVALTNYFGHFESMSKTLFGVDKGPEMAAAWEKAVKDDPEGTAKKIKDHILNNPGTGRSTAARIVLKWKDHDQAARENGSRVIGSYEGGSHLVIPDALAKSASFTEWWMRFHWGEDGAALTRGVNQAILKEFPDAILSNYYSVGRPSPSAPWMDGHYADRTPLMQVWDEFARPEAVK